MSAADQEAPPKAAFETSMHIQTQLRIIADDTASHTLPCSHGRVADAISGYLECRQEDGLPLPRLEEHKRQPIRE